MPKRTGVADLPLHTGTVPRWLADRMRDLGRLIAESVDRMDKGNAREVCGSFITKGIADVDASLRNGPRRTDS